MGSFEITVLCAVLRNLGDAYGVSIADTIEEIEKRDVAMGAIYSTLDRLERKGYLRSSWSGPTAERGGRRKRLFEITAEGHAQLSEYERRFRRMSEGWTPPAWGVK